MNCNELKMDNLSSLLCNILYILFVKAVHLLIRVFVCILSYHKWRVGTADCVTANKAPP